MKLQERTAPQLKAAFQLQYMRRFTKKEVTL